MPDKLQITQVTLSYHLSPRNTQVAYVTFLRGYHYAKVYVPTRASEQRLIAVVSKMAREGFDGFVAPWDGGWRLSYAKTSRASMTDIFAFGVLARAGSDIIDEAMGTKIWAEDKLLEHVESCMAKDLQNAKRLHVLSEASENTLHRYWKDSCHLAVKGGVWPGSKA